MIYTELIIVIFIGLCSLVDIKKQKIPNYLIIIFSLIGIYLKEYSFIINFLISILLLFILYKVEVFGAGDIKLIAVISGYLGLKHSMIIGFLSLFMASFYALFYLLKNKILYKRMSYFFSYAKYSIKDKVLYKYNGGLKNSLSMVMSPFILLGYVLFKLIELWKIF